jgi:hypothetical protein
MIETMWTCCDNEVYDQPGIMAHLASAHGLTSPIRATQKMVQAIDGPGWSLNTYEVRIGEMVLHKSVKLTAEDHHPLCECDECISAKGGEQ